MKVWSKIKEGETVVLRDGRLVKIVKVDHSIPEPRIMVEEISLYYIFKEDIDGIRR